MRVDKLAEGLWRWTAPHPAWKPENDGPSGWPQEVNCFCFEPAGGSVVLVDPLVPSDAAQQERFWRALDADVARRGGEVVVVLTNAWHGRSAGLLRERYAASAGCRVMAHAEAVSQVSARVTDPFHGDEAELPGGLRAHRIAPFDGGECMVELPGGAGLVFGDAVMGADAGRVRVCPPSWQGGPGNLKRGVERLQALLSRLRPFERLLTSHGEPVLAGAGAALRGGLDEALPR